MSPSPVLLHVEDDADDALLIGRALRALAPDTVVRVVCNGREAIDYLEGTSPSAEGDAHPRPQLVLLDLNTPVMNGLEFLGWLRTSAEWATIPVVILSSSNSRQDIRGAYEAGANAFLTKPLEHPVLREMLADFTRFWFTWNRSPGTVG